MQTISKFLGCIVVVSCLISFSIHDVYSQSKELKIDLDMYDVSRAAVTENDYKSWQLKAGKSDTCIFGSNTIILTAIGEGSLKSNWYKGGIAVAKLVNDGICVADVAKKAQIELRIKGLSPGEHTLLTYHNVLDKPENNAFPPFSLSVNGIVKRTNIVPGVRMKSNVAAVKIYTKFQVSNNEDAVFLFQTDDNLSVKNKTIFINALEIDCPNADLQAQLPYPAHADEHVDADKGTLLLKWLSPKTSVSRNIYVGTDRKSVASATKNAVEYKGNLSGSTFQLDKLTNRSVYYWRVDEIDAKGEITPGNVWFFRPRHPAFEDAEGYGRFARGGRDGKVVEVTTLEDNVHSPPVGSLRWALKQHVGEPITIVFSVSGMISLKGGLVINRPYVTVAGQTAPGKGICIRNEPFGLSGANDAIVRFLRVRVGGGKTSDGMGLNGSNHSIIDHCSISWTLDESFSSRSGKNISFQRNLIAEPLNVAGHKNYKEGTRHGYAASISGDIGSFHHNLLAQSYGRNWSLAGGLDGDGYYSGRLDIFNNVVYNWGSRTTDGGAHEVNFVGNYYKPGAATTVFTALNAEWDGFPGSQKYYCMGNIVEGKYEDLSDPKNGCRSDQRNPDPWSDKPFFPSLATIHSAADAYKIVLSDAGANQPTFDDHDVRILNEVYTGINKYKGSKTGLPGIPDSEQDVGAWEDYPEIHRAQHFDSDHDGLPDWWERIFASNLHSSPGDFSDANAYPDKNGYTQLEKYLGWMANPHYDLPSGKTMEIALESIFFGFKQKPVYTVSDVKNCQAEIKGNKLIVKTLQKKENLASFTVKVKDADNSVYYRTIGIHILYAGSV
ncbi:MAG: T9SS C-terminal target domain-containing protein [Dysgonamonadaceae bacterium]|nr:T9SS C-terminal target domain-containing protein [Dysgonamonadaceae bacterium]